MPESILYEQVYDLLYQSLGRKINKPIFKHRAIDRNVMDIARETW